MLDALPPIVVFDTRKVCCSSTATIAWRLRGSDTVEAEVRSGSRHDALRYAAREGVSQRGISSEEAASYTERYVHDWRTSEH